MPFHEQGAFPRLECFGNEDIGLNPVVFNLLVCRFVDVERVEAIIGSGVLRHLELYSSL